MSDSKKTKGELIAESEALYARLAELEKSEIERKRAEKALKESEERYRMLVEEATDIICTVDMKTGLITSANSFGEKALGYQREEVLNRLTFLDLIHPEDHEKVVRRLYELAFEEKRDPNFPFRLRKADDAYMDAEINGSVMYDSEGKPETYIGVIRDVTEHRRVEEALRESKERFQKVAENAQEWIWEVDARGLYTYASPIVEKILGYKPEEIVGKKHFYDFFDPKEKAALKEAAFQVFEMKQPFKNFVNVNVTKNGERSFLETSGAPILDSRGDLLGYRGADIDITARKQAEEALKESEEKYRQVVENANESIIVAQDGVLKLVNPKAVEFIGYSKDELTSNPFVEFIHPDDRAMVVENHLKRLRNEEIPHEYDFRIIDKDGNANWVHINAVLTGWEGRPATLNFLSDVTERRLAEEALKESEERYRTLVENSLTGIYIRQDEIFRFVNKRLIEMVGYSREELLGMPSLDLIHPDDRKAARERAVRRMSGQGPTKNGEFRVITKNGDTRWVTIFGALIDYQGKPAVLAHVLDITERKRAEELLRERERFLSNIFASIQDGISILDTEFNVIRVNATMERWYSHAVPLKGKKCYGAYHQRTVPCEVCPTRKTLETGQVAYEVVPKREAGGEISGWLDLYTFPLFDSATGQLNGVIEYVRDITDRKRAEELLRASEEKYRTLFEESKDVVYITTPDGEMLDINPAGVELFGYSSKEKVTEINVSRDLYMNPSDRDTFQMMIAQQGFVKDYELALKRKDGQPVIVILTATTVRDDNGNIVAYRGIMRDITEKKQLERQLFQAQKMESMGTLAGGIAHDFNNLLGGILGYASFMKSKIAKDDSFFNYLDTIEKSAVRASELTAQLLAFARGGKYEVKPVDLNSIVNETLRIIGRTFDKSIEIETNLFQSPPTIEADAGQIQQVIMNLCVNASDAMPFGGKLIIETGLVKLTEDHAKTHMDAKAGLYVVLSVTDTGVGMDRETMERIFEPFFTTKEEGKGTGLGLSMVYGVVKNHEGHIRTYSEPGEGTTFKVYLPISGKAEVKEPSEAETLSGGDELVLIVDDEESIRLVVQDILESYGYRTRLAENGAQAIDVYKKHKDEIGLVILDMVMPKMGGHETFLELKKINPKVRALLSTGYSQDSKAKEILDNGAMGFVQKPYMVNALLSKVRSVLDAETWAP